MIDIIKNAEAHSRLLKAKRTLLRLETHQSKAAGRSERRGSIQANLEEALGASTS